MTSTLDLTPRTTATQATARGVGSNAETAPTNRPAVHAYAAAGSAFLRATRPDYFGWLDHVRAAAGCTRPIRLTGSLYTVQASTGRIVDEHTTASMPDGAIYKACGNRRGAVCPPCSRTYQRDAFHVLRSGLVGGKGVPTTVSRHPAVFATLTAPSFGSVHTRAVKRHTCANRKRCDCRPEPCHPRRRDDPGAGLCQHNRPAVCWARHDRADTALRRPLCLDCYDHDHQVVWNITTGQLWHRTKRAAERHLATLCRQRHIPYVQVVAPSGKVRVVPPVRLSHGKVAELQTRGAVHFHTLLRLDGVHPSDPTAVVPPPAGIGLDDLADTVELAATHTAMTTPAHPDRPDGWPIAWGEQLDVRPITLTGTGEVTDSLAAGYLAKYATKSTEATGHTSTRLTGDTIGDYADPDGDHTARLIDACWRIGRPTGTPASLTDRPCEPHPTPGLIQPWTCPHCGTLTRYPACPSCAADRQATRDSQPATMASPTGYARLRRWAHMLGFGGHFLTKARRYCVTFRVLRDARVTFRRHDHDQADTASPIRAADHLDEETTLIVGTLTFAGAGWHTTGDALLANTAADLARSRRETGREELAHEHGSTTSGNTQLAA
jgi:hypothetical protein